MKKVGATPLVLPRRRDPVSQLRPFRVGILGHVGNENLGDEAIIAAVIQNVRHRWPDAELHGFTLDPADTQERHGILSFPIRRGGGTKHLAESTVEESAAPGQPVDSSLPHWMKERIKRIPILFSVARDALRVLETLPEIASEIRFLLNSRQSTKGLDLLIFAGSHQLNDFVGGPWAFPYTVLKWALLGRAAGAKLVFLSLGGGPIDTWLGRRFIRRALKLASYRSYRDETTKQLVDSLHVCATGAIVPDLAFSLDYTFVSKKSAHGGGPVVGINPLPLYADYWYTSDERKYETYVGKLATFADWLVDRGCEVRFIPTQLKVDPEVIDDVRRRMTRNGRLEHDKLIGDPTIRCLDDLLSALSELDLMVATRYHGILLALALHKPVLAIAYHEKSRDLMNWLGLGDYVIDGDTFSVEALKERFPFLERESGSITNVLRQRIPDFQSSVLAQYNEVFSLMEATSRTDPNLRVGPP